MRVITGTARGCRLETLEGLDTRPTGERVKEGLFSAISFEIEGRRVLDLFAGSGQMGIEALSRGAHSCVFVDRNRQAADVIRRNLQVTKLQAHAEVVCRDSVEYLTHTAQQFDLVFLDPPYASGFYQQAVDLILEYDLLAEDGQIIAEHDGSLELTGVTELKTKRYGKSHVSRFIKEEDV